MKDCLRAKVDFVKGLSNAVGGRVSGVESLDYAVFEHKTDGWYKEYLVVNYKGGAVQARNCSGNSNAAILEELSMMVYTSQRYYLDTEEYKKLVQDTDKWALYNIKNC